jgi:Protein of unknown function (DUF1822)
VALDNSKDTFHTFLKLYVIPMIYSTETLIISMPLTQADLQNAGQFAQEQSSPDKAKQVYDNTIAVLAVNHYLQLIDIETDLKASDCWNLAGRLGADIADLMLPGIGRLECRPTYQLDQTCFIPPDALMDRVGYVFVQIDEAYREGVLLGFVPKIDQSEVWLNQIKPLDDLIDHLASLEQSRLIHLRQWLNQQFESDWQTVEAVLKTSEAELAIAFRGNPLKMRSESNIQNVVAQIYDSTDSTQHGVLAERLGNMGISSPEAILALTHLIRTTEDEETRWTAAESLWMIDPGNPVAGIHRVADLGMQLGGHAIALMVAIVPKGDKEMAVLLRIYPMGESSHLPPGLELRLLDEAGNLCTPAICARGVNEPVLDPFMQLKLYGQIDSQFSVEVKLGETNLSKNFVM